MEQIDQNQSMDSYKVFPSCLSEADSVLRPSDLETWGVLAGLLIFPVHSMVIQCLRSMMPSDISPVTMQWTALTSNWLRLLSWGSCRKLSINGAFLTPSYVDSYDLARVSPSMVMHRVICMYIFFFSPSWWSHQVYKKNLLQCSRPQSPYVKGEYTWHRAETFMDLRFYSIF